MIFTGSCEKIPWYMRLFSGEFCSDTFWDRTYAHGLIKHFTTAFLLAELMQNAAAGAALTPDSIDFLKISYLAQGY
jgi:hypothetical protein